MNQLTRPLEIIETEINFYKQQTATGIIEIGKRLIEAKSQLQHGEWGKWLEEKVDFSQVTAARFMKISNEYSNLSAGTNLGARKLFLLLDVPQEEREQFIEENNVEDMTTRELQEAIKAKKEAEQEAQRQKTLYNSRENAIKAHQEALAQEKEKTTKLEVKVKELENRKPIEKEVIKEVMPQNIQNKLSTLETELNYYKQEAESYKNDSKKLEQIKDSIKHLESHRDKLNEYIFQMDNLAKLRAGVITMLKNDLAPMRYSGVIEAAKNNSELMATLEEVLESIKKWLEDMTNDLYTTKNNESEVIVI